MKEIITKNYFEEYLCAPAIEEYFEYLSKLDHTPILFSPFRLEPGHLLVRDIISDNSVLVTRAQNGDTSMEISQPSDCLLLKRYHVQCSDIEELNVRLDSTFIATLNGPADKKSPDTWKEAVHHLLDTCRPLHCYLNIGSVQTGIADGHEVNLTDGTSYKAYWNEPETVLGIIR